MLTSAFIRENKSMIKEKNMAKRSHTVYRKALAILLFIPVFILMCVFIYFLVREGMTAALMNILK